MHGPRTQAIANDVTVNLADLNAAPHTTAYAHHRDDDDTEREYDRLRDLARAEASKRNSCFDRVRRRRPRRP